MYGHHTGRILYSHHWNSGVLGTVTSSFGSGPLNLLNRHSGRIAIFNHWNAASSLTGAISTNWGSPPLFIGNGRTGRILLSAEWNSIHSGLLALACDRNPLTKLHLCSGRKLI